MSDNFDQFKFNPASLSAPRPPGISAYMRVKNEERFVRLAIESHLPFYDEIIAVYNDCTDATPQILHDLAAKYPQKIKVFHYLPQVVPTATKEHTQTPTASVHSMANYYNYALSQCSYRVAVKLDADHLAIPCKLAPLIKTIRTDMAADKLKVYTFSGINLIRDQADNLTVSPPPPPRIVYSLATATFFITKFTPVECFINAGVSNILKCPIKNRRTANIVIWVSCIFI